MGDWGARGKVDWGDTGVGAPSDIVLTTSLIYCTDVALVAGDNSSYTDTSVWRLVEGGGRTGPPQGTTEGRCARRRAGV